MSVTPHPLSRVALALIATMALVVGACSSAGASPSTVPSQAASAAPTSVATAPPSASPSPSAAAFPVTLTDDEGTSVTIEAEPQKIVSITPANTEILYAIDAGDRVVATDDGSDYPAEAAALPHVATFNAVDVEQIVGLDADLVVAGGLGFNPPDSIAKLRSLGIPVLVLYASSVDGVYKDIALIGQATGEAASASALAADMQSQIDATSTAAKAAAGATLPRVYYEVGYTDATGEIFAPADKSFVAEMVSLAGAEPITTGDPNSYAIPLENLIASDPQAIILGTNPFYMPTPEAVKARAGWDVMTAVKDDQVRTVADTEITRPGPRLPVGLRNLAIAINPALQLPAAP